MPSMVESLLEQRSFAVKNISKLQEPHTGTSNRNKFINVILGTYGIDPEEMGGQEKCDLAMMHLTYDLLLQNFYDPDGNPTKYGRAYRELSPNIDLTTYEYVGI